MRPECTKTKADEARRHENPDARNETPDAGQIAPSLTIAIGTWTQPQVQQLRLQKQRHRGQRRHRQASRKCHTRRRTLMPKGNNLLRQQDEDRLRDRPHPRIIDNVHLHTLALIRAIAIEIGTETDPDLEAETTRQPLLRQGLIQDRTQQGAQIISPAQVPNLSLSPLMAKTIFLIVRKTKSGPSLRSV